jgi:hypothetical protein
MDFTLFIILCDFSTTLPITLTWEEFVETITNQFKALFAVQSARDRLANISQTHSVDDYIKAYQNLLLELDITEDEARDKFIRGLKDDVHRHVLLHNPPTLEKAYESALIFATATRHGHYITNQHQSQASSSATPMVMDDPMDLSALQQQNQLLLNLLQQGQKMCYYCQKPGHIKRECRKRIWDEQNGNINYNRRCNNNNNRQSSSRPQNNYNNNSQRQQQYHCNNRNNGGGRQQYHNNNNRYNNNNFRQQFNSILQFDPLLNDNNSDSNHNNFVSNSSSSFSPSTDKDYNKNLINLDFFENQDSSSYPVLSPISVSNDIVVLPDSDFKFLNNLNNDFFNGLPLYKAMVGGSDFKLLIDSGAGTCYVHPKLLSHVCL